MRGSLLEDKRLNAPGKQYRRGIFHSSRVGRRWSAALSVVSGSRSARVRPRARSTATASTSSPATSGAAAEDPVPEGNTSTHDIVPNANERVATYAVTDGVTDEQFDEALTEAKDEGNLSRAPAAALSLRGVRLVP